MRLAATTARTSSPNESVRALTPHDHLTRLRRQLVAERIEDGERGGADAEREPHQRGRLLVGEREALAQEIGDFLLLSGFRFETGEQCELHDASPSIRG